MMRKRNVMIGVLAALMVMVSGQLVLAQDSVTETPGSGEGIGSGNGASSSALVAKPDSFRTETGQDVTTSDVLKNDTSSDGSSLSITFFTQGENGEVVNNGDGTFTYTPKDDFVGEDGFTYTIKDNSGKSAVGTVNILVADNPGWFSGTNMMLFGVMALFLIMMIFSSRTKRKQAKKRQSMLETLKKGEKVVTIGGIRGTIMEVKQGEVVVKVDETNNIRMRFTRSAIHVVGEEAKAGAKKEDQK